MNGQTLQTTTVGKLTVASRLNFGAQGEVYNTNHSDFLLKVCKPEDVDDINEIKAIKQESIKRYRTFSQLKFEADKEVSCLPLEYIQVEDGGATPAYLMRRASGQEMQRSMKALVGLNLRDRYQIARSLAHSLGLLHSRGVVHADFKADNFFFDDKGFVQILDIDGGGYFGSMPSTIKFYPSVTPIDVYRAPEFMTRSWKTIWNQPNLRKQPDLWSLAVLIYQILVDTKGPFPTKLPKDDPSYTFFRAGDYATDHPEWPRAWQKAEMEKAKIASDIVHLFESVFRTTKRTLIDNPQRPDTLLWRATLDSILKSGVPQSIPVTPPKPTTPQPATPPKPVVQPPPPTTYTPPLRPTPAPFSLDSIWQAIKKWFT